MKRKLFLLALLFPLCGISSLHSSTFSFCLLSSQIRVRVLTDNNPDYLFFTVLSGNFIIDKYDNNPVSLSTGEVVVLARYQNKVVVKRRHSPFFTADSIYIKSAGGEDRFSLRTEDKTSLIRIYSGDLQCIPDMGSMLFINVCDIESYIGGVVRAEGGNGKKEEYFKTQAIIARTYTYRHLNRHILDRYNLCDDTHCQVFNGIVIDSLITKAVDQTRDLVIVTSDSSLIISAFHSNCGGETSPSEYAWPSKQPYLVRVIDPFCLKSRNASWEKAVPLKVWTDLLVKNGFSEGADSITHFDFNQPSRVQDYVAGSFRLPFSKIRTDLDLRSAWFSVKAEDDSIRLTGRGYGHGVGLCQEGAIVMAAKGFVYEDIIRFYYPGVKIINIVNAKRSDEEKTPGKIQKAN